MKRFNIREVNEIVAYTDFRMPFQPNGEKKDFREQIKNEIRCMRCEENCGLIAEYSEMSSACRGAYDLENVLIYNFGTSVFKSLTQNFITLIDRPCSEIEGFEEDCITNYYCYRIEPFKAEENAWWKAFPLCIWDRIQIDAPLASDKPIKYFRSVKRNQDKCTFTVPDYDPEALCIEITVFVPSGKKGSITKYMKPLIDGIICAFHRPALHNPQKLCSLLSEHVFLNDTTTTFLSKREYVRLTPNGERAIWNPQDDILKIIHIQQLKSEDDNFYMSGGLYELHGVM